MSRRVIHISYRHGLEAAEAEPIGEDADGSELYRVWRPGRLPGEPVRVDVVRLRRQEGEGFDFVGVADPARRGTAYLTIASACLGMPACDAFRRQLEDNGCVVENQSRFGGAIYLVVSHPTGVPIDEWHRRMLRESIGVEPEAIRAHLHNEARTKERQRRRRQTRQSITAAVTRAVGSMVTTTTRLAIVGFGFTVVGGGLMLMFSAAPSDRPRVAAIGMVVALAPALFSREGRGMWPVLAGCASVGVATMALLRGPAPGYGAATALGAIYAVCLGLVAVILGIFSLFSSSSREMARVVGGVALPALASALAAAVVAVTSAAAAGHTGGLGSGLRVVGIGLTALLLLGPAAVLFSNIGAIFDGKVWRANPKLQRRALASLPLATTPMLLRVGVPIALIWVVVWLLELFG